MAKSIRNLSTFLLFLLVSTAHLWAEHDHSSHPPEDKTVKFVENKNQWEPFIRYEADVPGGKVFFEGNRLTYSLADLSNLHDDYFHSQEGRRDNEIQIDGHAFRMELVGANANPSIEAGERYAEYRNYFVGDDPARWAGEVGMFGQLTYEEVYPGIDWVLYGRENAIKYDFIVRPGQGNASAESIALEFDGLDAMLLDEKGNLKLQTSVGEIVEMAPVAFQNGIEIPCVFEVIGNQVKFNFPSGYNRDQELVIDPNLIFASFTGSTADNFGYTATYDDLGNLYGGGIAFGVGYPTSMGAFQTTFAGGGSIPFGNGFDISITKFSPTGTAIVWSTYLGGADNEQPQSLITNSAGELFVYGRTWSNNYPTTAGAYQPASGGGADIVVTRFDAAGSGLIGSTYVGGSSDDGLNIHTSFFMNSLYHNYGDDARGEIMIDGNDNVYIASCTQSANFPVTAGAIQGTFGGGTQDGCVFQLNPTLTNMQWATYMGGSGNDAAYSVKVDPSLNVFVAGGTESPDFPTTSGSINPTSQGGIDGFVARIDPGGAALAAATYLGTSQYDQCYFLEIDNNNDIYVVGQTTGAYPVSLGVYSNPGGKQFITKMDDNLSSVTFSTVFGSGGTSIDISPTAFLVDRCGFIYVSGWGGSVNFSGTTNGLPLTADAFQSTTDGSDIYLIVLGPDAANLEYATYFGGPLSTEHVDGGTSRFNPDLEVYHAVCAGCGGNSDFPTTAGVVSSTNNSPNCNLGVFKFGLDPQDVVAAYAAQALDSCAPYPVDFSNASQGGAFYVWDYGDGSPRDTIFEDQHTYINPGTYTVTLIAVDSNSCNISDTATATITVYPNPFVTTDGADTLCAGSSIQLQATGGQFYDWSPPLYLNNPNISNPISNPLADITYQVIVSDTNGCVDTAYVDVGVTEFSADAGPPVSFCEGQGGAQLQAGAISGGVPPYYYVWWCDSTNTFCGLDSMFDDDPIALPTQTTTYYLQVQDANGCLSAIDSTVVEVLPVPIADAGPDQFICQPPAPGALLNGSFSNAPGPYSYYWTPSAGLNDPNILTPYARPDTTTIYTLVGVSANGCSSVPTTLDTLSTVTVTVHPQPIADAGPDLDICLNDTTQIQGLGYGAGPLYDFEWSPYTGLSDSSTANPFANPHITTEYILTVWSNGCPSIGDTMTLNVHTLPTPTAGNISEICLGDSAQLDAFAGGDSSALYTYQWLPTDGLSNPTAEDPMASPDSTTWYYLVATSSWGCDSELDSVLVKLKPTPIAEAGNDTTLCSPDTLTLLGSYDYSTTDPAPTNEVYFSWTPNQQLSDSTELQPTAWPGASVWYHLDVRHNTCSTSDSVLVTVIPEINAMAFADTSVICGQDSVLLTATGGLGDVSHTWTPGSNLAHPDSAQTWAAPDSSTLFTVVLEEGGCFDTAEVMVDVIPSPAAAFLNSTANGCVPLTVSFLENSDNVTQYIWNFGDGSPVSNEPSPIHEYMAPGIYEVSFVAVNLGACADSAGTILVEVSDTALADFVSDPAWPTELTLPEALVNFSDRSTNANNWVWDFGDGEKSGEMNPAHVYDEAGEYFVTLEITNEKGCLQRVIHGPFVVAAPDLFIPNVFSPNADDLNDTYLVNYSGTQPFILQVFDRWGVMHFSSKDKLEGWRGTDLEGSVVPEGTYYYNLQVGDKEFTGPITLVR